MMILLAMSFSCIAPKKNGYPSGKPFVYKTTIKLEGKIPNDQKQELINRLQDQLDDSLRVRTVTSARWAPPFIYKKLVNPPVFDSLNLSRSIVFMNGLLLSMGYSTPVIQDSIRIDTVKKDQYRTNIIFSVSPGKRLTFDSISFDLQTPALQAMAIQSKSQSWLKKGNPYSKQILSTEIQRLVDTFRNNGYYKFSKEDLYMEQDTVIAGLIDPTLDPFQQADLLEQLKRKREVPTVNIVVKQRPVRDSSHLTKYYIGKVTAFPDLPLVEDSTTNLRQDTTSIRRITLITRSKKFNLPFVANNIFLRPDRMYKQENYYRTFNRFNQLSAWQYINIDFDDSNISDTLLDITLRMYPAKKQNVNVALEAARNTNDIVTATNLFGVGVNLGLQNRNAYKQSVRTTTNLRGGVELGKDFIQTVQASISHSIFLPRLIVPFNLNREGRLKNVQTVLNVNASYIDRRDFYTLKSINGSWGYQWTRNNRTYIYRPLNIEYSILGQTDSLKKILASNPALRLAFRTGLVVGQQFAYSSMRARNNKSNRFRFSLEESGATLGFITALDKGDLLRFVKGDVEFVHNIDYGKTQLVMRGYAGMGFAYGRQGDGYEKTLPFYKAYFAGGPNSMRAWQVRQLGLGSSKFYSDTPYAGLDRFGDIQLEGNVEYRFPLGTVFGIKLKSAFYTDIGNIWNWNPIDNSVKAQGSDFNLGRFYKELAVGAGTGLRLDFSYFLIRLDWAYKLKDPQRNEFSEKWFYNLSLGSGQFQLGINYPF
ncbi:MAG TPA: BamA/TamA family outer membrane protein [Puia sp.]|nr:BamA/TamA family outer membrane protein [Puia sp.]